MINLGLNKHAILRACEFSLQLKQFEKAFDLLEALQASGFPIRQHYFWPFFAGSSSEKGDFLLEAKYALSAKLMKKRVKKANSFFQLQRFTMD